MRHVLLKGVIDIQGIEREIEARFRRVEDGPEAEGVVWQDNVARFPADLEGDGGGGRGEEAIWKIVVDFYDAGREGGFPDFAAQFEGEAGEAGELGERGICGRD